MKKICTSCGRELEVEQDFSWKYKSRGVRHARCKFCMSQGSKQHYADHKQSYLDRNRLRSPLVREDNQRKLAEYLACHPCVDCGKMDVHVLEFDHVSGSKSGHISKMVQVGYSWSAIEAEIAKCEVRCANCHRIRTGQMGNSWRNYFSSLQNRLAADPGRSPGAVRAMQARIEKMQRLHFYFSVHPCVDCGNTDIRVLDFDHVYGEKGGNISRMIQGSPWLAIEAEIAKCEVRCANCHRIKTIERGQWWRIHQC